MYATSSVYLEVMAQWFEREGRVKHMAALKKTKHKTPNLPGALTIMQNVRELPAYCRANCRVEVKDFNLTLPSVYSGSNQFLLCPPNIHKNLDEVVSLPTTLSPNMEIHKPQRHQKRPPTKQ